MVPQPLRAFLRLSLGAVAVLAMVVLVWFGFGPARPLPIPTARTDPSLEASVAAVDAAFFATWSGGGVEPAPEADGLTLARRLSLALTGAPPSLEELRRIEALPAGSDVAAAWVDHLLGDRRSADYLAERLARSFVGVETGPFLVYRRRRLVSWLADQIAGNRPYDALVRDLIAAEGLWTTRPETNFVTVTIVGSSPEGPDAVKLAARTSRAFLGVGLDCVQCHDDKLGGRWKQEDFHRLAAFFAQSEMGLSGLFENKGRQYRTRYLGRKEAEMVSPAVPFAPECLPAEGTRRERLARWVTDSGNPAFARATANRAWAILCGRPLLAPLDQLPPEGPFPAALEALARDFSENGHDYRRLLRVIARSSAFRRASHSGNPDKPITREQEDAWAAFPATPLRPEQVAGSVIQASTLRTLDADTHILQKIRRFAETREFVSRYGDPGEEEFNAATGTIPQRLLLMNGKLVRDRVEPNPLLNASTLLARHAPDDSAAVRAAFMASLSRPPDAAELAHFSATLAGARGEARDRALSDLCWALLNSSEFSWNR